MVYIKFAIRCSLLFIPGCLALLYFGAHQPFVRSLIWSLAVPLGGFVILSPVILSFSQLDRSLWSTQAERARRKKRLEYLAQLRREEYEKSEKSDS